MLMQANYFGFAPEPYPLLGAQQAGLEVEDVFGTNITTVNDRSGFPAVVAAARRADVLLFAGVLNGTVTVEREEMDKLNATWPGNQLYLVKELAAVGKPLIIAQFGGEQLDD